jgi:hypothetical protein
MRTLRMLLAICMCQGRNLSIAAVAGLSLAAQADAQDKTKPETINKIRNNDGLTLGNGVSLDRIFPAYDSPFVDVKTNKNVNVDPHGKVTMTLVTTAKALDTVLGVNVEAKARFMFGNINAKSEFTSDSSISDESFRLVIVGESAYGDDQLQFATLKPIAAALIEKGKMEKGKMKEFAEIYGTHYVSREHRVANLVLTVGIDQWSETTKKKLLVALDGKASCLLGGGELSVAIQNDLKEAGKRKTVNVEISTVGGEGLSQFGKAMELIISSGGDLANVAKSVETVMAGFKRENSGIGSVTVSSYRSYGWVQEGPLWDDIFERKLQDCADAYRAAAEMDQNIRITLRNTEGESKKKLQEYAGQYQAHLMELADFGRELLKNNEGFVKKQFPKEPDIDLETAKLLFVRFKTLQSRMDQLADRVKTLENADLLIKWKVLNCYRTPNVYTATFDGYEVVDAQAVLIGPHMTVSPKGKVLDAIAAKATAVSWKGSSVNITVDIGITGVGIENNPVAADFLVLARVRPLSKK